MHKRGFILSIIWLLLACQLFAQIELSEKSLDPWVNKVMDAWDVPGAVVAVVSSDEILFAKGYGVKTMGGNDPVDKNSLFGIASISKSFTAMALAMLVEEERLDWDDKVIDYLPDFAMSDPWVTQEMTVMDLLIHRSGLPSVAGGTLWYRSDYSREEIIRRIQYLNPSSSFRSHFDYQNVMYMVAGEIIPAVTDTSWDDFVKARIFNPLGMVHSNTSIHDLDENSDLAATHAVLADGKLHQIQPRNHDNCSAAAGINTSAQELSAYLQLLLRRGEYKGSKLLSPEMVEDLWKHRSPLSMRKQRPIEEAATVPELYRSYGLGWINVDHRGERRIYHSGGIDGYRSLATMIPEKDLGIIVMANNEARDMVYILTEIILDMVWGIEEYPYVENTIKESLADDQEWYEEIDPKNRDRNRLKRGDLKKTELVGVYQSEIYGDIEVIKDKKKLRLEFSHTPCLHGDLFRWEGDTYLIEWDDLYIPRGFVTFGKSESGLEMRLEQPELLDVDFTELHPIIKTP